MAQDKDAPVAGRRGGSSEHSAASGTLDGTSNIEPSTPARSAAPRSVEQDEGSLDSFMPKRKPRLEDTSAVIQATRLRSNVKTTPNASRSMKNAHERRAQQTPDNTIDSPSNPTPTSDGNTADPFTSPGISVDLFGSQQSASHPILPSLQVQQQQQEMDFVFPQDLGMYSSSSNYADPNLFTGFLPENHSDSGSSAAFEQQWMQPSVGLSSRQMPPAVASYATKPQPEAYVQRLQQHPQRYSSREPQPFGYGALPSHGPSGYHHHANYPLHPPGLRVPHTSPVNGMMVLPSMSDPQLTYGTGMHAPSLSPSLRQPPMHALPPQPLMNVIPPTPLEKGKQRAVPEAIQPQPNTDVAPTLPDKGKQRAVQEDVEMSSFSSTSEADDSIVRGRLKDSTVEASLDVYKAMDATLYAFCKEHGVSFSRALKGYSKRHNLKLPVGNLWNTYCKMHAHPDYTQCELDRVEMTTSTFGALPSDDQQRVRSECWVAFQKTFNSKDDCRIALDIFKNILSLEDKEHGTTLARREKQFNATANNFAHAVRILFSSTSIISP